MTALIAATEGGPGALEGAAVVLVLLGILLTAQNSTVVFPQLDSYDGVSFAYGTEATDQVGG